MYSEPPIRHPTTAAIEFIATRLGLRNEPGMQDWEFEVAEAEDLNRYLSLYAEMSDMEDVRFTLADMILQAFAETEENLELDPRWTSFCNDLVENIELHAYQIWYWSSWDVNLEDAWKVTPYMRELYKAHFSNDVGRLQDNGK